MKTYNNLYMETRNRLREMGVENPQFEARLLVAGASGKTVAQLLSSMNLYATDEISKTVDEYLQRRKKGEPVEYIVGTAEFFGMTFKVTRDVLIPRMDTETLIYAVKDLFPSRGEKLKILDLCTGSGNIPCVLANEYPQSSVTAVDISPEALEVCRENVNDHHFSSRINCMNADVLKRAPIGLNKYDLIISNPPYIETTTIKSLDKSVKNFEPKKALDGGSDGLKFYKSIIKNWSSVLGENGHIIFELGEDQYDDVEKLLREAGFNTISSKLDTIGVKRAIIAGR